MTKKTKTRIAFVIWMAATIGLIRFGWIQFLGLANPYSVYFEKGVSNVEVDGQIQTLQSTEGISDLSLHLNPMGEYVVEYQYGTKKHKVEVRPDIAPPNDSPSLSINKDGVSGSPNFKAVY